MKCFSILNPPLYTSEISAGICQFNNGKIFNVGFSHLRPVSLEGLYLSVEYFTDIDVNVRAEILGCRPLVKQHVSNVAGGGNSRLGKVPVIGEVLAENGLEITVLEADERRIHKVRLAPLASGDATEQPEE